MSSGVVLAAYGCAAILPFVLIRCFGTQAWYWHVLSVCLAVGLGLAPIPASWVGAGTDLAVGSACTFLLLWGVAPLPRATHRSHSRAH